MEHVNNAKAALVAFFGFLTAVFGWFGWLVILLFLCIIHQFSSISRIFC